STILVFRWAVRGAPTAQAAKVASCGAPCVNAYAAVLMSTRDLATHESLSARLGFSYPDRGERRHSVPPRRLRRPFDNIESRSTLWSRGRHPRACLLHSRAARGKT